MGKNTGQPNQESSKKKQAGEFLKNADRFLKSGEFGPALEEVEKCLEIDPGNFYAHAYKERIIALRTKQQQHATPEQQAAPAQTHTSPVIKQKETPATPPPPVTKHEEGHVPLTQEEARKKFLDEKRRTEEESRKQAEEARRRAEEELRRRAHELDAMRKNEETQRLKTETEARRKAENDEKRKKEDEQKQRFAKEEHSRLEAETRRKAEELARPQLEEGPGEKQATEQQRNQEEDSFRLIAEQAKTEAAKQNIDNYLQQAKQCIAHKDWDNALLHLLKIYSQDTTHPEAIKLLETIQKEQRALWEPKIKEAEAVQRENVLAMYKRALTLAWMEGSPDALLTNILQQLRNNLTISDAEHKSLESQCKIDAYTQAILDTSKSALVGPETTRFLARLRNELGITAEQHKTIEQNIGK